MSGGLVGRVEQLLEKLAGDEQREKWLDAFGRVYQYVPLSQYDEATKLAEYAFEEMMAAVNLVELLARDWQRLRQEVEFWKKEAVSHREAAANLRASQTPLVSSGEPDE